MADADPLSAELAATQARITKATLRKGDAAEATSGSRATAASMSAATGIAATAACAAICRCPREVRPVPDVIPVPPEAAPRWQEADRLLGVIRYADSVTPDEAEWMLAHIGNLRHALIEAAAEMDRRYDMGRAAARTRILALLDAWRCSCGADDCAAYDTRDQIAALIGEEGGNE
jgi:hypothetical protein